VLVVGKVTLMLVNGVWREQEKKWVELTMRKQKRFEEAYMHERNQYGNDGHLAGSGWMCA
jgi:hypothetical protein